MRRLMEVWRRILALRGRGALDRGLDEEIRFHLDRLTEKHVRAGLPPDEARRQALIAFGGVEGTKERARDEFRLTRLEDLFRDLRYGGRALARAPGFTFVVTVTLALGIGATTAMFSVVNGVLLRPLPYPEQDRLIELVHEAPGLGVTQLFASPAIYFGYREHARTFDAVGLWDWDRSPVTVTGPAPPEAVPSVEVTHELLPILGAQPIRGRGFTEADDRPGSAPTVIISHGYWQRRFGGADPLGEMLIVDGTPRQVIGVLPPTFRFFEYAADLFYPLQPDRSTARFPSFDGRGVARVKPGVTLDDANADVARLIPVLRDEFGQPGAWFDRWRFGPRLRWLQDTVVGSLSDTLWLLMGTIGLLLVIACANVANLVLVRTEGRKAELAIRAALGAGRAAVARVVIAESAILGVAGGVVGVAVAYLSLPILLRLGAADLPQVMTVTIDTTVLLVALSVSALATLAFALLPLVNVTRPRLGVSDALGARSISEGREAHRVRHLLLVVQVALALVLLTGAGLMIRTFQMLQRVDPGFRDPETVLTFQLTIPAAQAASAPDAGPVAEPGLRARHAIRDALAALPGVEAAAFSSYNDGLPLDGDGRRGALCVEGATDGDCASSPRELQFVSPQFFEALRTPIVAGRTFGWEDVYGTRRVAMVSENLARAEWGSAAAALGRRIATDPSGPWSEIVGVVADVHHDGLHEPAPQIMIFPAVPSATASFVVRSERVGTAGFLDDVRAAVWSVNPQLSPAGVQTLGDLYQRSMARTTLTLRLLAITGTMALVLGLVGVYGLVSYAIARRRREIGVRLALGARHREIRWMFVGRALVLVGIGVAVGLGAAVGLTRLMESQLFGVSPLDPATHLAVALGLLAAAALASVLSAQRISALNPVDVLRSE